MGGSNYHQHATNGQQQQPERSSSSHPKLEQVIELDDESGNISDSFLTLESLLDHDINLDEPLPLLPSNYDAAEPIPVASSSSAAVDGGGIAASQQQNNTTTTTDPSSSNNTTTTTPRDPNLVIVPHHHDVLLGRGGRNNQWSGNECLRQLARVMAVAYGSAHKRDKPALAWRLIQQVRSLDPPGRYVQEYCIVGSWCIYVCVCVCMRVLTSRSLQILETKSRRRRLVRSLG